MIELITQSKEIIDGEIFSRKYYLEKIDILLNTKNILVITWQRRVWKSYIILDFLKSKKIDLTEVFYLNKELDSQNKIKTNIELENLFLEYEKIMI